MAVEDDEEQQLDASACPYWVSGRKPPEKPHRQAPLPASRLKRRRKNLRLSDACEAGCKGWTRHALLHLTCFFQSGMTGNRPVGRIPLKEQGR